MWWQKRKFTKKNVSLRLSFASRFIVLNCTQQLLFHSRLLSFLAQKLKHFFLCVREQCKLFTWRNCFLTLLFPSSFVLPPTFLLFYRKRFLTLDDFFFVSSQTMSKKILNFQLGFINYLFKRTIFWWEFIFNLNSLLKLLAIDMNNIVHVLHDNIN